MFRPVSSPSSVSDGLRRSTWGRRRLLLFASASTCLVLAGLLAITYWFGVFSLPFGLERDTDVQGLRPDFNAGVLERVEERLAGELQVVRALGFTREEMDTIAQTAEQLGRGEISPQGARERLIQRGIAPQRLKRAIKQLQILVGESSDAP